MGSAVVLKHKTLRCPSDEINSQNVSITDDNALQNHQTLLNFSC